MPDNPSRHDWERPGAFEVAPGVHRIPLPLPNDGLRAVNVYAIEDGAGLVLIDSGWALEESRPAARGGPGPARARPGRHQPVPGHPRAPRPLHPGAGGAPPAGQPGGAGHRRGAGAGRDPGQHRPVPAADAGPPSGRGAGDLARQLVSAAGPDEATQRSDWEDPDEWLPDGTEIVLADRTLRAIATPGHTRGHLVFHDAQAGLLFAGDHVLPHITPSIGFEPLPADRPLADYLNSLATVEALADAMLLPAHGPVAPSAQARAGELVEHHRKRLDAMLAAVGPGVSTAFEVAGQVGWTSRERALADLDVFNQMLAVNETIAHLDVLADRGALRVESSGGVRHYLTEAPDGAE